MQLVPALPTKVSNHTKKKEICIHRFVAEEIWSEAERVLESREKPVEFGADFRFLKAPLLHASAAETALLVADCHRAPDQVEYARHVMNIGELETARLNFVLEKVDHTFVRSFDAPGKQPPRSIQRIKVTGDILRIRGGLVHEAFPVDEKRY